jgi:uncharacterized peroxidase-related enzyme
MSNLPQIEPTAATGEAAELLAQLGKAIGPVPNMAKAMANSPALLKGYMGLSSALSAGVLAPAVRERLALAAAEYNRCSYCLSGHTMLASRVAKIDDDEIARARHADPADPHIAALSALSDSIMRRRGDIQPAELKAARTVGITDTEIAEVVGNLALNLLTNYFNIVAGTDNDYPLVTPNDDA